MVHSLTALVLVSVMGSVGGATQVPADEAQRPTSDPLARSGWSRVLKLAPAAEVVVAIRGSQPGKRYFVRADETQLVVLNLDKLSAVVDATARRVLLEMTTERPEYLTDPERVGTFVNDGVRVGREGVFVADRKVADLDQIIEHVARETVVDIRRQVKVGGSKTRAALWAAGGYFAGGIAGGVLGGGVNAGFGGEGLSGASYGMFLGAPIGIIWGGIHGYRSGSHWVPDVIYRAP